MPFLFSVCYRGAALLLCCAAFARPSVAADEGTEPAMAGATQSAPGATTADGTVTATPPPQSDQAALRACETLTPASADPAKLIEYEQKQLPIGNIAIAVDPVFDTSKPEEDNWLYRKINEWHFGTDPDVIRADLLVEPGQPFTAAQLAESERLLRSRQYLRDARIYPVGDCADAVDLEVRVKDVWTLLPDLGFSRKGGENSSHIGFRDSNFLGTGRAVNIAREQDEERTGTSFGYRDPNIGHSHSILDVEYIDSSDGASHAVQLYRPFFSLDTPWAGGVTTGKNLRDDSLYFRGDEIQSFTHDEQLNSVFAGWSQGRVDARTVRWRAGINEQRSDFSTNDQSVPGGDVPTDRHYLYPWLEWELIQDRYVKATNVNQMRRTEDINIGWSARVRLGQSDESFGAGNDATVYGANAERYWLSDENRVLYVAAGISGYYENQRPTQQVSSLVAHVYQGDFARYQFYTGLELQHGRNLFVDKPIMLGGDNGLRGYPANYQVGDRRALLSLEQRYYLFTEVLALFDVGAAVFFDVGRAWYDDRDNGANGGWLRDVGFGLRLTPTRTGGDLTGGQTVLHLDVATPLDHDEDPDLDTVQWLITIRDRF